ncbi:MAG: alpha/beta hydrolase [Rhodobacteraceae bacterium]|nr:alpha/beta hydrolase [Paracoccaceae bacterium]
MATAPLHDLLDVPVGGKAIFVSAKDGTKIRIAYWQGGDRGTVLLLPGRTEYIEKYGRMVAKLQSRNMNVVVIDWRGQGLSQRHDERRDRGYVESFQHYQQDIAAAMNAPEIVALQGPRTLFSHSMGGCIALRALVDGLDVEAAVFSSPMWGLPGPAAAKHVLNAVNTLGRPFGQHKALVPGTKPTYYVTVNAFEGNELTNDADHYAMFKSHLDAEPNLGLGGPTIHWAVEAIKEMDALMKASVPDIPVLTFLGTQEIVVDGKAMKSRALSLPNTRFEVIENGKHEIWMETPEIQAQVWDIMDQFLDQIL